MPYQRDPNWEMQSPSGNSGIFYTVSSRTVKKINDERSTEEPFSAMGSYLLLADMMLSAFSAARPGDDLQSPSPARTEFSFSWPPPPSLQRNPPGTASVQCLSRKKRHRMTGMDEIRLPIPSKPFHFTFPKGNMLPKSICFLKRLRSSCNSISQWEKALISSRSLAQLCLGVYSLLYAPTGRANIHLVSLPRTEHSNFSAVPFLD